MILGWNSLLKIVIFSYYIIFLNFEIIHQDAEKSLTSWVRLQNEFVSLFHLIFELLGNRIYMFLSGWSSGAKVLGKLSVLRRSTNLDTSRAKAYFTCDRCGKGLFGHFFSHLSFLSSFSLSGRMPDID